MKASILLVAALLFLTTACSPGGQVATAVGATYAAGTATATAALTETAVPTPAPSPTALPEVISTGNVSGLSVYATFGAGDTPRTIAFSPDGTALASAGGNTADFDIRLWDATSGALLRTLSGHTGIVWNVAFSPDGTLLASGSNDQTVKVWNWNTGELVQSIDYPYAPVSVRFSPDGQILAVGAGDGSSFAFVWLVSTVTWEEQQVLAEYWNIPDIAFSPDGQTIAAGGTSRNVRVWRTSDGAQLALLSHPGQVSSLAIAPNGATLAAGLCEESDANLTCTQGAVWLWNLTSGTLTKMLSNFSDGVRDVSFSPDGSMIVAAARNSSVIVYDAASYEMLLLASAGDTVEALALSPDGRLLATVGNSGISLWRVEP